MTQHNDKAPQHRGRRRYFLSDIPLDEALQRFFGALEEVEGLSPLPAQLVPVHQAQGRITAAPINAAASSPHYDAAAMDGIAVKVADTTGASETAPVSLAVGSQVVWVDTGDPMPPGYNAVVMIEHVHQVDESTVQVMSPVAPWQHVRTLGEDLVATEMVLPENHRLRPVDLGACAAASITEVPVRRQPKVAIIPTGNELVPPGSSPLKPGDIVEFNTLMLAGLVLEWGGHAERFLPVRDDFALIRDTVKGAIADYDLVIVNAGSSAGSEDYTAAVVEELGQLLVHGVAVRPGHPVVLGLVDGKPVIGLPGYPVSAVLTAELFVKPMIDRWLGMPPQARPTVSASITRKVLSPLGEDEYLRVKLGRVGGKMVATPLQRGAGVIMSLVKADGLLLIPRFSEGLDAGTEADVQLLRPLEEVENTIVVIGSHDLTLDLMNNALRRTNPGLTLSSSHIGSLGGLIALRRGEAHLAGSHLLDEATSEYNVSFIRRYLPDVPRSAGELGEPDTGNDGPSRKSLVHSCSGGPCTPGSQFREPAARLRHPRVTGLQVEGTGHSAGAGYGLRAGGIQPLGGGGGSQERLRFNGVGHPERGDGLGPGLCTPARRALRPCHPPGPLRKRPATTAVGPPPKRGLPSRGGRLGRVPHRGHGEGCGRVGLNEGKCCRLSERQQSFNKGCRNATL